jgi:hypothetical protein
VRETKGNDQATESPLASSIANSHRGGIHEPCGRAVRDLGHARAREGERKERGAHRQAESGGRRPGRGITEEEERSRRSEAQIVGPFALRRRLTLTG